MNKYGLRNSDEDLLKEAQVVGSQARALSDRGLTKANRKYLKTDSFQKQGSQARFSGKPHEVDNVKPLDPIPKIKPDPKKNEKKEKKEKNKDSNQQN